MVYAVKNMQHKTVKTLAPNALLASTALLGHRGSGMDVQPTK